jgi:hypothetical protein
MRIVLTGATGLIGGALAPRLGRDGHEVVALSRRSGPGLVVWDPDRSSLDPAVLAGAGAVIHLAGEPIGARRWSEDQKRRIRESRVRSTELLATTIAAMADPPAVFLSGSAIGFYGERGDEALTESSAPGRGFLAEVCEAWEAATSPLAASGVRVAHLRTGIVLDPQGGALAKQLPLFRFFAGGRLGSGRQWWSWISLADEVEAIVHLLTADVHGPVNLTAPAPVTNGEFTRALGQALRRPTFATVPTFGPRLLLGRDLADSLLFTSARVLPRVLEDSGYRFEHPTIAEAFRAIL